MYYVGLMSGTSTDGVDAVLVEIEPRFRVRATHHVNYPGTVKRDIERRAREKTTRVDKLCQLDVRLGRLFAQTVIELLERARFDRARVRAIGSHGQTLRHHPQGPEPFTLQIAQPAIIAELTGIATVADFRAADLASGGQGAPLTPAFHAALFRAGCHRVVVNVGGVANITSLPADPAADVLGFDTGPGNCLSDEWIAQQLGQRFDDGGDWAAQGRPSQIMLDVLMADDYFAAAPPKTTGRGYFNMDWVSERYPALHDLPTADVQATLLAVTAQSIVDAIAGLPHATEVFVCGGGAHNKLLMRMLAARLAPTPVATTETLGLAPDWVEAAAFAWLAHAHLERIPGNLPSVTGARRPRVLGALYPP